MVEALPGHGKHLPNHPTRGSQGLGLPKRQRVSDFYLAQLDQIAWIRFQKPSIVHKHCQQLVLEANDGVAPAKSILARGTWHAKMAPPQVCNPFQCSRETRMSQIGTGLKFGHCNRTR